MKIKHKASIIKNFLFVLIVFILPYKSFSQDVAITVESGVIPPEFNKNNDTLIIFSLNPFYSMSMKKHLKRSYTGPFVIVRDFSKHSYSVETCRYVLEESTGSRNITTIGGPNNGTRSMVIHGSFVIYDRKTKAEYVNPNIFSPKLMRAYLKGLDEARLK